MHKLIFCKKIIISFLIVLLIINIQKNIKNENFISNELIISYDDNCEFYINKIEPFLIPEINNKKVIIKNVKNPDILLRSHFCTKNKIINKNKIKNIITVSGETYDIKEDKANINFKTKITNKPKDIWFPYILFHIEKETLNKLQNKNKFKPINNRKNSLLYINSNCVKKRDNFFRLYQKISGNKGIAVGKCQNNYKSNLKRKKFNLNGGNFQDYKFIIAMENSSVKGYCTEKILNAYLNGSIPIYWGCSDTVSMFFNPDTYIDLKNFKTDEDCIKYILELEKDKKKMYKMQNTNIFKNGIIHPMLNYRDIKSEYNIAVRQQLKKKLFL